MLSRSVGVLEGEKLKEIFQFPRAKEPLRERRSGLLSLFRESVDAGWREEEETGARPESLLRTFDRDPSASGS